MLDIGNIPTDDVEVKDLGAKAMQSRSKQKWEAMINMAKKQQWNDIEATYPYEWIIQGSKLKSLYLIQTVPDYREHGQHMWIWGKPGTGKSAFVEMKYPKHYKKRADKDWLGYNPNLEPGHRTVYFADFDQCEMKKLSPQQLKVMCDPQGFNADKKYAGGDVICPSQIIITSNFRIGECFGVGVAGIEQQKAALRRRFREIHIDDLLAEAGLVLKSKVELQQLKNEGNFNYALCFNKVYKPVDTSQHDVIDLSESTDEDEPKTKRVRLLSCADSPTIAMDPYMDPDQERKDELEFNKMSKELAENFDEPSQYKILRNMFDK